MRKIRSLLPEGGMLPSLLRKGRKTVGSLLAQEIQSKKGEEVSEILTRKQKTTSVKKAKEIMGEALFCGPEMLQKFWGIETKKVPPVPYSDSLLQRAKQHNMSLQYFPPEIGDQISAYELERLAMRHVAKIFPHGAPDNLNYPLRIERDSLAKTQEEHTLDQALREKQCFSSGWKLIQSGDVGRRRSKVEQIQAMANFEKDMIDGEDDAVLNRKNESSSEAYFRMNNQLVMRLPVSATVTESTVTGIFGHKKSTPSPNGRTHKKYVLGLRLAGEGLLGKERPQLSIGAVETDTHEYVGHTGHSYRPGDTWPKTIVI